MCRNLHQLIFRLFIWCVSKPTLGKLMCRLPTLYYFYLVFVCVLTYTSLYFRVCRNLHQHIYVANN